MKAAAINFKYKNWEYFQYNHYPKLLPDRFPSGLFKDCYVSSKFNFLRRILSESFDSQKVLLFLKKNKHKKHYNLTF